MIYTPTIVKNVIGGGSSNGSVKVSTKGDLPLNTFIQTAATEKTVLTNIHMQVNATNQADAFNQLLEPVTFTMPNANGDSQSHVITPNVDPYQLSAVIKNLDTQNFTFDGLSGISFNIQPNVTVVMKLGINKDVAAWGDFIKKQMGAPDSFDLVTDKQTGFHENDEILNSHPLSVMIEDARNNTDLEFEDWYDLQELMGKKYEKSQKFLAADGDTKKKILPRLAQLSLFHLDYWRLQESQNYLHLINDNEKRCEDSNSDSISNNYFTGCSLSRAA